MCIRDRLYTYYPAFSRLHGYIAHMVRMVGENSISAGFISLKHRYRIVFSCTYISVRTYLLLCYLSVGSVSGHCFVGIRQTKEKPVPLFTSNEMVAVQRFRSIHYHDGCRFELFGYLAGTV